MDELNTLLQEAGKAATSGDLEGALTLLTEAPSEIHLLGRYQFAKGALLFRTKNLDDAIIAFENAIKLGPPIPEFFSNLGAALVSRADQRQAAERLEDINRAIKALERAMDMGPKLPHTYVNLGGAWLKKDDREKARYYFELALELSSDFEPAKRGLAAIEESQSV